MGQSELGWWFMALIIAVLGYTCLRGCEAGCSYVHNHVDVQWKAVGR